MIVTTSALSTSDVARGNFSGVVYQITPDWAVVKRTYFPPNCSALIIDHPVSGDNYGPRQYLVGGFTANILVDEEFRCLRQGIRGPNTIPSVSVGAGTNAQVCYTRFFDEVTGERSPLSEGKAVTGDLVRVWTNLPTDVPDEQIVIEGTASIAAGVVTGIAAKTNFGDLRPGDRIAIATDLTRWAQIRTLTSTTSMTIDDTAMATAGAALVCKPVSRVSHVELWVSVFGGLPRFIARLRIGTTSFTESTATLALGEAEVTSFEAMPYGTINLFYNDRQLVSGVDGHRDTVYLSAIGFPERWEGLSFRTAYGEPIVGMFRFRDYVVLLCPRSSYKLQGYTEDDYVRTVLEAKIGGLGHLSNAVAETRAFVPSADGVQIFNGAFHPAIPTRNREWQKDYGANRPAWESGFAIVNPNDETYQFYPNPLRLITPDPQTTLPTAPDNKAFVYVACYDSVHVSDGGDLASPDWFSDTHKSPNDGYTTFAAYVVPSGQRIGKVVRGDNLGYVYEEDETDGIAYNGAAIIVPAQLFFGEYGGDRDEGKKLVRFWSYVESEDSDWSVRVWPGDERAYPPDRDPDNSIFNAVRTLVPTFQDNVGASRHTGNVGGYAVRWQPKTVHIHGMELPSAGRGHAFEYRFTNPIAVKFYGLGGVWSVGRANEPVWTARLAG